MKIFRSLAVAAAAGAMALGVVGTTAASAAPGNYHPGGPGSPSHPFVYSANYQGSVYAYRHGRLYIARGPSVWINRPHFTRWNSHEAIVTGTVRCADSSAWNCGTALVFYRRDWAGPTLNFYFFTNVHIVNSYGVNANWNMRHSRTWVGGR